MIELHSPIQRITCRDPHFDPLGGGSSNDVIQGVYMGLVIRPAGEADEVALRSLYDWLSVESEITANAEIAYGPSAPQEGTLGVNLAEYLTVVPFALGVLEAMDLVTKIEGWIKSRHRKEGVLISNSRGESVLVTTADAETVAKVALAMKTDSAGSGDGSRNGHEGSGHGRTP